MFIKMEFEDDYYLIVPPDSINNNFLIKVISEKDKIDFPHLHNHIYNNKIKAEIECLKLEIMRTNNEETKSRFREMLSVYTKLYPEYII